MYRGQTTTAHPVFCVNSDSSAPHEASTHVCRQVGVTFQSPRTIIALRSQPAPQQHSSELWHIGPSSAEKLMGSVDQVPLAEERNFR